MKSDEKVFAEFPLCEVDFSPEYWTMRLGNLLNAFAYFLDARDELFHIGYFFVDGFVFHSRGY